MKKLITIALITIFALTLIISLAACGDGGGSDGASGPREIPNEERIRSDIATNAISPITNNRVIDSIEIINEETDTDSGQHYANVRVFSNDSEITYIENMRVAYIRNEDREWVLSSISPDNSTPVLMSPLVGAKAELAREAIMGAVLIIDEDEWIINEDRLDVFSIANQNTNLEQNRDIIVVDVELKDTVLSAVGQMQVEFRFNDGKWESSDYRVSTEFETSVQAHAVLNLSDDDLLAVISRNNVVFSASTATEYDRMLDKATTDLAGALLGMPFLSLLGGSNDPTEQSFSFTPADVTDFEVLYTTVSDRGTVQTFYSTFRLNKEFAIIDVNAQTVYRFDDVNGWLADDTAFVSRIEAVANLTGTRWTGIVADARTSHRSKQFILDITEFNEDGTMKAVFNLPGEQRSGTLTGFFDTNRLSVTFNFDEWIQTPRVFARVYELRLDGYLFVEDLVLRSPRTIGSGDSFGFSVTLDSWFDVTSLDDDNIDSGDE
jgi:hypothetical protein